MNLDKRRSRLINAARLLVDAGSDQTKAAEITLGVIADLGLRSASPGKFDVACEIFEQLAVRTREFDSREALWGPWGADVEVGVVAPYWDQAQCYLAETINGRLDFLLDYSRRHGVFETVPSQGFHFDALFAPDVVSLFNYISAELVP
jgi:hypothetical protein